MGDERRSRNRHWRAYAALAALVFAMAIFGPSAYRGIERDLSAAATSGRAAVSILAAATLSHEFQRIVDIARSLATRVRFGELIAAGQWTEAAKIMTSVPRDFAGIEQVIIVDPRGEVLATVPQRSVSALTFAGSEWLSSVVVGLQPAVTPLQRDENDSAHADFFVAVPIGAVAEEGVRALLVLRVNDARIAALFADLRMESGSAMRVVDREGRCVFDSSGSIPLLRSLTNNVAVKRVLGGATGVEENEGAATGEPVVAAFAPALYGWGVVTQWRRATVFAARDAALRRLAWASVVIVAMTALVLTLLMRLIAQRRQTAFERELKLRLESSVKERTAQLEAKNTELESFSYSVSHDLRAPLRAIDGFAHLLVEEAGATHDSDAQRYASNVRRNVAHMSRLIDELLELSRVGRVAIDTQPVDMTKLAGEALSELLPNDHAVRAHVGRLISVHGDPALLQQVWINLIDNAIKYSSRKAETVIRVDCSREAHEVVYCVEDNGAGFDMQYYDRLFKPFSRLHGPGEFAGTGVGLALVKRIIDRHGGRMWAESILDGGTKMYFSLPNGR